MTDTALSDWLNDNVEHTYLDVGEVRLHVAQAGEGDVVILLHGFPEFWYSWRHQIRALVAAGYRVVAPDMRGYNLSDKPKGIRAYDIERLVGDIAGLVDACGVRRVHLVSHDWGGAVAWTFAMLHPEKLERLVVMNCPHPLRMLQAFRTIRQLKKSWYMAYFQIPWLPERTFRAHRFGWLRHMLRKDPARPDAFSAADVERYVEAFEQPGAVTGSINYYRALRYRLPGAVKKLARPIEGPVMVIWGEKDRYLGAELAQPPAKWVANAEVVRLPEASHWVNVDQPEAVNEALLGFLKRDD